MISTSTGLIDDKFEYIELIDPEKKSITLRGTNEVLALNMNGVSSAGNLMNAYIIWTEE
jgi:hypothetical protein